MTINVLMLHAMLRSFVERDIARFLESSGLAVPDLPVWREVPFDEQTRSSWVVFQELIERTDREMCNVIARQNLPFVLDGVHVLPALPPSAPVVSKSQEARTRKVAVLLELLQRPMTMRFPHEESRR